MKRISILKILNLIIALLLVNQAVTGFFHDSISDEVYEVIHAGGGILFVALALLHLILNWNWIKANYFRKHLKGQH